jgi:uncharacterized protein YndB with AHSA1/START domain
MADILHELTIAASPEQVYKAVTEQDGLASWWTQRSTAQPKVGTTAEFGFMGGQFTMKMKVTKLEPFKEVDWDVLQSGPDWAGTHITWDLTPVDSSTKVLFGHRDWTITDGSYASVNYNWGHLLTSLKSYLETGKGTPDAS